MDYIVTLKCSLFLFPCSFLSVSPLLSPFHRQYGGLLPTSHLRVHTLCILTGHSNTHTLHTICFTEVKRHFTWFPEVQLRTSVVLCRDLFSPSDVVSDAFCSVRAHMLTHAVDTSCYSTISSSSTDGQLSGYQFCHLEITSLSICACRTPMFLSVKWVSKKELAGETDTVFQLQWPLPKEVALHVPFKSSLLTLSLHLP